MSGVIKVDIEQTATDGLAGANTELTIVDIVLVLLFISIFTIFYDKRRTLDKR